MTSFDRPSSTRRTPYLLGSLFALIGMGLALLSATGVAQIATGHVSRGVGVLVLSVALRVALAFGADEWSADAGERVRATYRSRIVDFLRVPRARGERARTDLARAVDDVAATPELDVLSASARVSLLGVVVIALSAGLLPAGIVVVLLGVAVPLYRRAGRRSAAIDVEYRARRATLEGRQLELINHTPDLRALGAVEFGAAEIGAISDSEHTIIERAVRVTLGSSLVTEFLGGVSVGLVAMVVGFDLLSGRLSLVRGLIAVLISAEIFLHVRRFGVAFHRRDDARSAEELLRSAPRDTTANGPLLTCHDLRTDASEQVHDLAVSAGDRVRVAGPSGSGKTTLLHTLIGWRAPHEGVVTRRDVVTGFVSPESTLMSGTLWDNIACSRDLDRQWARSVLDALGLTGDRFGELDQTLGADGRGLSSGERVRVVLARAILARAQLLILDDIAGVLDGANRTRLRETLDALSDVAIIEATAGSPLLETGRVLSP